MKITTNKVLVTVLASIATVATVGCAGKGGSMGASPAKATQNNKAVVDACTQKAVPEIGTAEGKEVTAKEIPQGEYNYAGGEIYVYSQGAKNSSFLEAFVTDTPDTTGEYSAQLACSQVDAKSSIEVLTQDPTNPNSTGAASATTTATSADASTRGVALASAELSAALKLTVQKDGHFVVNGMRHVFAHKDAAQDNFEVVQNVDPNAQAEAKSAEEFAAAQSSATGERQTLTKYFLSDKSLTILVREEQGHDGITAYNMYKIVMTRPTAAVPTSASAPATATVATK